MAGSISRSDIPVFGSGSRVALDPPFKAPTLRSYIPSSSPALRFSQDEASGQWVTNVVIRQPWAKVGAPEGGGEVGAPVSERPLIRQTRAGLHRCPLTGWKILDWHCHLHGLV